MDSNLGSSAKDILFQETQLGDLKLKNKFIVAPLTRCRADPIDGIPNDLMMEYYTQRASFGLIISEASYISPMSNAFPGSGGISNEAQAQGWKKVTDSVHAQGGLIINQIWHCGRAVSSNFIGGKQSLSSYGIKLDSVNKYFPNEPYEIPHELSEDEIKGIVEEFRQSAVLAQKAGFDGLQLQGANGYLVDQFLRDGVNQRTDKYGGSVENRCRFCLEVIDAFISVFGSSRISVRLSPTGRVSDMYDSNPMELMKYLLGELSKRNLAFVELKRHRVMDGMVKESKNRVDPDVQIPNFFQSLRQFYKGNLVGNDGVSIEEAISLTNSGILQAVSFGVLSISNPDLPERVFKNYDINKTVDYKTLVAKGARGYTDFAFSTVPKS